MKTKLLLLLFLASLSTYAQTNLVPNGGFETWTNSTTLSNWTIVNNVTQNTSSYSEGSKSVQLSIASTALSPKITTQVPMTAGTTYTVKFKYKHVSGNLTSQHPISLNISKNGSAATLSSSTYASGYNWTVNETTFKPDQNLSYDLSISTFNFDAAAFTVLIDDVQVYAQGTEQYTLIPDLNFEKKLIALGIDYGATDGKVITNNINKLTYLDVSSSSITDLTGIQDFVGLTSLNCYNNQLTALDVSKNVALTTLICYSNKMTTLNISNNTSLINLNCRANLLSTIDITKNVALESLDISFYPYSTTGYTAAGKINSLDVSKNISLKTLSCQNNPLSTLDLSKNVALTDLFCDAINLTSIDISKNLNIKTLSCNYNLLTNLNIAENLDLNSLICDGNQLTSLDISKNVNIKSLSCTSNKMNVLDLSKNLALTSLICSYNNLTSLDLSKNLALTSLICSYNNLTSLDISNNLALTSLTCTNNKLTSLDVSKNISLTSLQCYINQLSNLDVSKNVSLTQLQCGSNPLNSLDISKNLALNILSCSSNQLSSLDISKHLKLKELHCSSNLLTTLDVSKNTALTVLICDNNNLSSLNIKNGNNTNFNIKNYYGFIKNPNLTCITVDDVSYANTNWADKKDSQASYSSVDCSLITLIPDPKFEEKLIALGIDTDGKNGVVLNTSIAAVSALDLSNSSISNITGIEEFLSLTTLNCSGNLLKKINLSKNTAFTTLNCSNNPNLTCIQVADVAYATANWATIKDATASFSLDCTIYTLIPDSKFEDKLISLKIDNDGKNGKVATESIVTVISLDVSSNSISDLTGIQDFVGLTTLNCNNNKLTTLDVSKNVALATLYCTKNQLVALDVSKNISLTNLNCYSNNLTALDVSKNLVLKYLDSGVNKLSILDVSKNVALISLNCNNNQLTTLDVSKNLALQSLNCSQNITLISLDVTKNKGLYRLECNGNSYTSNGGDGKIKKLDLSNNPELQTLYCGANQIDLLDLSANNKLTELYCYGNVLTRLDVSKNASLTTINCNYNKLKSLNLRNGKNTLLSDLSLSSNPNLSCIEVDDIAYSNTNWSAKKDVTANFSTDCGYFTTIPDSVFEDKLIALGIDTDGKNGKVLTSSVAILTSLDVSNAGISDLTGIEDVVALQSLNCDKNSLTKIDLSKNIHLISLNCSNNQLVMLNVVNNTKLQTIHCNDNLFKTLDFSKNTSLTEIYCPNNKLVSLNLKNGNNAVSNGPSIKNFTGNPDLSCIQVDDVNYSNTNWPFYKDVTASYSSDCAYSTVIPDAKFEDKLIALGIDTDGKNGKVLTGSIASIASLDVSSSSITDLTGIQDFVSLTTLRCNSNQLTALDVSKNVSLRGLYSSFNKLATLEVSKNTALTYLDCYYNLLTTLDVSKNVALTFLDCNTNKLTTLDVSNNVALTSLYCSSNQLTAIDVSKNTALTLLSCGSNQLTAINVAKNISLATLSCDHNQLTDIDVSKNVALSKIFFNSNKLISLNLKNGKNNLLTSANMDLSNNANLYCILVDDITYSNANWSTKKDAVASFNSVECIALLLPSNNFTIESKGETCLNSNNGEINISATAAYTYKASINGTLYSFTNNSLKVPNLTPGTYTISITIPGETFEQSFTVIIPKGATITGKSSVVANKISVEITEGTAPYTVFVDGVELFETTDSNFTVETKKGGLLQVKTAKACEGIYAKDIARLDGVISAYPNPTAGSFEIEIPTTKQEVVIALYTLNGNLISNKTYPIENGKAQLSLENQPAGVYVAKIELDTQNYLKIIKN